LSEAKKLYAPDSDISSYFQGENDRVFTTVNKTYDGVKSFRVLLTETLALDFFALTNFLADSRSASSLTKITNLESDFLLKPMTSFFSSLISIPLFFTAVFTNLTKRHIHFQGFILYGRWLQKTVPKLESNFGKVAYSKFKKFFYNCKFFTVVNTKENNRSV